MTDHHRVFHVGAARLLPAAVREEIDVADRLEQTESVGEILRAVGVNDVNEMGIGGIQFPRLFPEQMVPEEGRGRIEARYAAQQQILPFQQLRGAAGHVCTEAETDHVDVGGIDAQIDGVQ